MKSPSCQEYLNKQNWLYFLCLYTWSSEDILLHFWTTDCLVFLSLSLKPLVNDAKQYHHTIVNYITI